MHKLFFFWLTIAWLSFLSAVFGIFYPALIVLILSLSLGIILFFQRKSFSFSLFQNFRARNFFYHLFLLGFIFFLSLFSSPTIFSGRDPGSIAETAIRLSQNHRFPFENEAEKTFWEINSAPKQTWQKCRERNLPNFWCQAVAVGPALNFSGFHYTFEGKLLTQFPPAYSAYLAFFYSLLGLNGFAVANAFSLYIFVLAFQKTVRRAVYSRKKEKVFFPYLPEILLLTSFPIIWFGKFTLTENLAEPLLWLGIYFLWKNLSGKNTGQKKISLFGWLFSFGLLSFTRIEGPFIFLTTLLVWFWRRKNKSRSEKGAPTGATGEKKIIWLFLLAFALLFSFNALTVGAPFYKTIFRVSQNELLQEGSWAGRPLWQVFFLYGLFWPFLMGAIGLFYAFRKKKKNSLLPFLIISPTLLYFFNPHISADHPWLLRRFAFSLLPVAVLYSVLAINVFWRQKKQRPLVAVFLLLFLAGNIYPSVNFFYHRPQKELLKQTGNLSLRFDDHDLILIDSSAYGNGWTMPSGPLNFLFGKQAVYFFNPSDWSRLDCEKYANIYLLVADNRLDYYRKKIPAENLLVVDQYEIKNRFLKPRKATEFAYPEIVKQTVSGKIVLIKCKKNDNEK